MRLSTCVAPAGHFVYGVHKPGFRVANLRRHDQIGALGKTAAGNEVDNRRNFPDRPVEVEAADWIYEIPNPFPFRGTTYIDREWADPKAEDPGAIRLPGPAAVSLSTVLQEHRVSDAEGFWRAMPTPVLLALAATATDPDDLVRLAHLCCEILTDAGGRPTGLRYAEDRRGRLRPVLHNHPLFETLVNNRHLPDEYKEVMVLRPGVQGGSEIVGDWLADDGESHIFEYLRRNSYIPWGHYASNMAHDAVRYRVADLTATDMAGLRHLYYQRTYVRLAAALGIEGHDRPHSPEELDRLRAAIVAALAEKEGNPSFTATLWGWNYGFDFAPTGYRLHASHQQIHQQFALVPATVDRYDNGIESGETMASYGCGDLVADFIERYREETGRDFFACYLAAIAGNRRLDGRDDRPASLVVHQDEHVVLFVPKAQTSQWELMMMTREPVGNVLEADAACRAALDRGILGALRVLTALGARMVTNIEFPKRFDAGDTGQRLCYSFLPRLPESPGAFSETQLRFINGHYPEDFAAACRGVLAEATADLTGPR